MSDFPFTVDIRPADQPVRRQGLRQPPPAQVALRFTDQRRLVTVVNNTQGPIFNVEVREHDRPMEWLSMRLPRVPPGERPVRLGQEINDPTKVYLVFDDPQGRSWTVESDGQLGEAPC